MLTYSIRILDFMLGLVKLIVYNELLNKVKVTHLRVIF